MKYQGLQKSAMHLCIFVDIAILFVGQKAGAVNFAGIFSRKGMAKEKTNWDDIPSLNGLGVDWEYEPENPLGKRAWARMANNDLASLFAVKSIPVKVVSTNFDKTGQLLDLSKSGLAVLLPAQLDKAQPVKIGLFLGRQKVLSRAVVRNTTAVAGKFRIGMEFVGLDKDVESYIAGLGAAKAYKSV